MPFLSHPFIMVSILFFEKKSKIVLDVLMSRRVGDEPAYGTLPNFSGMPNNQHSMMHGANMENPLSGRRSMFSLPYATLQSPGQMPNNGYNYENVWVFCKKENFEYLLI